MVWGVIWCNCSTDEMKIAIIGRSEYLYESALRLLEKGYEIPLIITAKEAPEYKYSSKDFESLAKQCGARFIHTARINSAEVIEEIKSLGYIDIAVSINYSGIIQKSVIDLFHHGILNAHGGDLPRYRGNACMAWALINSETKVGLCVHKMIADELDSGDIITRKYLDIDCDTRVGEIFEWMRGEIPGLMLNAVGLLQTNPSYVLEKQSKKAKDALRTYPRHPQDGRIQWASTNEDVVRLVNASSEPFQGAFCYLEGRKLTIWRAELFDDSEIYLAVSGQISRICKETGAVEVITGRGKIRILEVSEFADRMVPATFITSNRQRLT